jgi:hypothetical protein
VTIAEPKAKRVDRASQRTDEHARPSQVLCEARRHWKHSMPSLIQLIQINSLPACSRAGFSAPSPARPLMLCT